MSRSLSCRLFSVELPKMFWLNSLPRCHLETPNQTPEAIIIHSFTLPEFRTETRLKTWTFQFKSAIEQAVCLLCHPLLPSPASALSAPAPRITWPGHHQASHTPQEWNQVQLHLLALFSIYYCPRAYKSLESINSVYSRNFYSLLPERGRVNLTHLISEILSDETRVHYSHIS